MFEFLKTTLKKNRFILAAYTKFQNFVYGLKKTYHMNTYSNQFYLNIGAGKFSRKNWRIIEYTEQGSNSYQYSNSLIDYNLNLFNNPIFPIGSNSVDLIYSSHVFEHLHDDNVKHILNESYRVLKKSGGIRLVMPDIDLAYESYQHEDIDFFMKINNQPEHCSSLLCKFFDYFSSIKPDSYDQKELISDFTSLSKNNFLDKYTNNLDYNNLERDFGQHMNWFNENKLRQLLTSAGFRKIKLSHYKTSNFPEMRSSQFDNTHPEMSIYMEAVK